MKFNRVYIFLCSSTLQSQHLVLFFSHHRWFSRQFIWLILTYSSLCQLQDKNQQRKHCVFWPPRGPDTASLLLIKLQVKATFYCDTLFLNSDLPSVSLERYQGRWPTFTRWANKIEPVSPFSCTVWAKGDSRTSPDTSIHIFSTA